LSQRKAAGLLRRKLSAWCLNIESNHQIQCYCGRAYSKPKRKRQISPEDTHEQTESDTSSVYSSLGLVEDICDLARNTNPNPSDMFFKHFRSNSRTCSQATSLNLGINRYANNSRISAESECRYRTRRHAGLSTNTSKPTSRQEERSGYWVSSIFYIQDPTLSRSQPPLEVP
jgi:hypothetical protein